MIEGFKKEARRNYQTSTKSGTSESPTAVVETKIEELLSPPYKPPSHKPMDESTTETLDESNSKEGVKAIAGDSIKDESIPLERLPTHETPFHWATAETLWPYAKSTALWFLLASQASMIAFAIGRRARSKVDKKRATRSIHRGPAPNQDGYHAVDLGVDLGAIGLGGYEGEDGYEVPMPLPPAPPPPPRV